MFQDQFSQEQPEKRKPAESEVRDESAAEGSIFSRNLELNAGPVSPSPRKTLGERSVSSMDSAERGIYFKIEARKVIDILRNEFNRLQRGSTSLGLVGDLNESWKVLWGNDCQFPVKDFSELFAAAYSVLDIMAGLKEVRLTAEESKLFSDLLELMSALASGDADPVFISSRGDLIDKNRNLARSLGLSSPLPDEGRKEGVEEVELRDVGADTEPRGETGIMEKKPGGPRQDISSSVDDWFSQVSELVIKQGNENENRGSQKAEIYSATRDKSEEEKIPQPGEKVTEKMPGGKGLADTFPAVKDSSISKFEPGLGRDLEGYPAQGMKSDATEEEVAGKPVDVESPGPGEEGAGSGEASSGLGIAAAETGEAENAAEIVGAYFREHGEVIVQVLKNNFSLLAGRSAGRIAQKLICHVDELIALAGDFELDCPAESLSGAKLILTRIAASGKSGEPTQPQDIRSLGELIGKIEHGLDRVGTAV